MHEQLTTLIHVSGRSDEGSTLEISIETVFPNVTGIYDKMHQCLNIILSCIIKEFTTFNESNISFGRCQNMLVVSI